MSCTAPDAVFGARISLSVPAGTHTLRIVPVSGVVAIDAFAVEVVTELPAPPTEEPVTPEPPPATSFPTDVPLVTPESPSEPTPTPRRTSAMDSQL